MKKIISCALDEQFIKKIHKNIMSGIREDAGQYSQHQRVIRGLNIHLTHPADIPEEMGNLIKNWKKYSKITVREIAEFHANFELIHPFRDGNGRVGRLIMVTQCLEAEYSPIIIENSKKAEYYDVLEYAQKKSEAPFIVFLVEEMKRTYSVMKKYF
ncbi:MAG: Fic family protein [Elusimicrobiota bacterium]